MEILNPIFEKDGAEGESTGRIVPIYRLTEGISQKVLSRAIAQGLKAAEGLLPETLPSGIREKYGLINVKKAYQDIHFPASMAEAEKARERLVFEELFVLACALGSMKLRERDKAARRISPVAMDEFLRQPALCADRRSKKGDRAGRGRHGLGQGDEQACSG